MSTHTRFVGACLAMVLSVACILASLQDDVPAPTKSASAPTETTTSLKN